MQKTVNNSYSACYIRQYGNGYMQPVDMPAVSSTVTLDSWVNQTNTRQYFGHSYATGEDIESYTIRVNSQSLNTAQSTQSRGLIGSEDNRTIAHGYENTGIVSVAGGTGFIVGNHHIATADIVYTKMATFYHLFQLKLMTAVVSLPVISWML